MKSAKKIGIAIFALLLTSAILLLFDLDNRKNIKQKHVQIAVFKMASRVVLDNAEKGVLDALNENGFIEGKNCNIKKFSAEGDMPTANMIANNIVSSKFDYVITISTPALQIMANANKEGKVTHVFCSVTDPYASGVGITGKEGHQHPKHLVGIGTFQPVEEAFEIAKQMNPDLNKVGTVWCPSEVCSEACLKLARKKCKELGIELLEASVESPTQILESAMSLTARGVEALWLGGDNVVELGVDQLINAANKAQIPLFINNPLIVYGNVLFGLGAEYYEVGHLAGEMASDLMKGKKTTEIKIENVVPQNLKINKDALKNIKGKWEISQFEN
ncbi:MAG: ABC transporter substrate-binding protein [Prolixibacteraceae bacterium]|nr:ABC transporter substrate-binding protein [Prolixibacteraceae bacterium]